MTKKEKCPCGEHDLVDLPEPTAEIAFKAGWFAAQAYQYHDWGPSPPNNAEAAWARWLKGRRNPHIQNWSEETR
jgi:hypothetical protein